LPGRRAHLHHRVAGLRAGAGQPGADLLPAGPGRGRRGAGPAGLQHHPAELLRPGPGPGRAAYAAVLSAGAVTGLVLGGVVVTGDLFGTGWRPVFAINVPIGIVLAAAVPRLGPPDASGG